MVRFEKGAAYTRAQIQERFGGSRRAALPTRAGRVVCLCVTAAKNPRAPGEVAVGGGERQQRPARALAASGAAVPVFVRAPRGGWVYEGERRVRALVEEPGALLALIAEGAPPGTALALLLEESGEAPAAGPGTVQRTAAAAVHG